MPRPLLPPRGIFVPAALIYNTDLAPAVRDTWVQLRGIAWGCQETPSVSLAQLSDILGKKRSTLYEHMRLLQSRGALRWRTGSTSEIIVVFPTNDELQFSQNPDKPDPLKPSEGESESSRGKDSPVHESGKPDRDPKPRETVPDAILKPFIYTLADVTGMKADLNYPRLAKSARKLLKSGYSARQIAALYGIDPGGVKTAWYERDWRGLKGQRPTP